MLPFAEESIDLAIAQCRLAQAVWAVAGWRTQHALTPELQRLGSAICALAGNDRELAAIAHPDLLDLRTDDDAAAYLDVPGGARSQDYLSVAAVLAWLPAPSESVYRMLRDARERAHSEGRMHVAVAAQERLAHHALLFGDVALARSAIALATSLASDHRLTGWHLRCSAMQASLAFDAGDADAAARILSGVRRKPRAAESLALFAPVGAAERATATRRRRSATSPRSFTLRCNADAQNAATAATAALLFAATPPLEPSLGRALRRSLLWAGGDCSAAQFFSAAARCGDLEQAAYAVDALRALPAPDRPYIRATTSWRGRICSSGAPKTRAG